MQVYVLESNSELDKVSEVILQLRPQYDLQSLKKQIEKQQKSGYQIAYVKQDGDVL